MLATRRVARSQANPTSLSSTKFVPRGGTTCRASDRLKFASQLLPGPLWAGVDHEAMSRKEGAWLVCHQAASQKPSIALVCLPWAGGQAAGYKKWMEHIHPRIELWAAALPGREKRLMEPPVDDIHVAVAKIAQVRVQHQRGCWHGLMLCLCAQAMKTAGLLARPFAIFGHSMGSLLACVAGPRRCPLCSRLLRPAHGRRHQHRAHPFACIQVCGVACPRVCWRHASTQCTHHQQEAQLPAAGAAVH